MGEDGTVKCRYLGVKELRQTTAHAIHSAIECIMESYNLSELEFCGLTTDGASVMVGCNKGVATLWVFILLYSVKIRNQNSEINLLNNWITHNVILYDFLPHVLLRLLVAQQLDKYLTSQLLKVTDSGGRLWQLCCSIFNLYRLVISDKVRHK